MPQRLKVIYLPPKNPAAFHPWGDDVLAAIGDRHDMRVLDHSQPVGPQLADIDVVIDHGGSVGTREMVDASKAVKLWQILGTGLDHFDMDYWRSKKVRVSNCPGPFSAPALAECAMMFILMLARQYPVTQDNLKKNGKYYDPVGRELEGLKLGIVGFGASGIALAERALPFGLKISAIDVREIGPEERQKYDLQFVGKPDDLDALIADVDILSLHLHLNKETRHIIDKRRLALLKPTAYLINVARGALVDEAAMEEALVAGKMGGAGLDAYGKEPPDVTAPLFNLPNVITTPHISGVTNGTSRRRAKCASDNVDRVAAGLEPLYRVD